ncbi:MAG TPA: ComEC/Rec2 family competence protein [Caldimonas sp.]
MTLVFFQQVSIVGFAANLIAIPLVTLVITPLALLGAIVVPLWSVGAWFVQLLVAALTWLAALPGAVWAVPVAPAWAQLAGLLGAVLLVLPLPWRVRVLAPLRPCRCSCRRGAYRPKGSSISSPSTSDKAPRSSFARATTCSSTTPARSIRATAMLGSACCCRCCVRAARHASIASC